jgi:hypothetical protein
LSPADAAYAAKAWPSASVTCRPRWPGGLRAALHGWVTLEATFVHPANIDRSFDRLVQGLATALANWADQPARTDPRS